MGEVLKKAGYNIEYVQADYISQFTGLKSAYQRKAPILLWIYAPHRAVEMGLT